MGDDGEDEEVMRKRSQGIYACQPFSRGETHDKRQSGGTSEAKGWGYMGAETRMPKDGMMVSKRSKIPVVLV
jgi:hypothetical protein